MLPAFEIIIDGEDITQDIALRLVSITVEDNLGLVNDRCTIVIDDREREDGTYLPILPQGATAKISLGYFEGEGHINPYNGLKWMGTFQIDDTTIARGENGRIMSITGRAVDTNYSFVKKPRSDGGAWRNIKLADLVVAIAIRNGFIPRVHDVYKEVIVTYNQTSRSDSDFLSEIATKHNAELKMIAGYLCFGPTDKMDEVLPPDLIPSDVYINETDGMGWDFVWQGRSNFTGVRAKWHNKDNNSTGYAQSMVTPHPDAAECWYEVTEEYPTQREAQVVVDSRKRTLDYQKAKLSIKGCVGYPLLMAGATLNVVRFRGETIPTKWRITSVTHTMEEGGYTCDLDAEVKDAKDLESLGQ